MEGAATASVIILCDDCGKEFRDDAYQIGETISLPPDWGWREGWALCQRCLNEN